MSTAINQEDFAAVKTLSKNYIFSKKQIEAAQSKKIYKDSLHGKLDIVEYYDPSYSKIDEILSFIKNSFVKNNIQDPDGYTNLRKEKNVQSAIIQQIKSGEHIEVLDNSNDWFLVQTKEGKEGYVHKSRIKNN
ncbi:SH3 domain-containing protein [Empedobacter sedimenti]|uniref:SH3 domain-containing protein n=1 Tax=Empedobacter sedimenti TaxID=3042610 RepID=UPI0024A68E61|nr:SH3 domain-containing protein [Empedobacter sedimenti]